MELTIAILGIVVAIVIGVWQIYLARQQVQQNNQVVEAPAKKSELDAGKPNLEQNLLHKVWKDLDPDLQDALSMAYNQAHRDGVDVIRTRYFLAAIARLQPYPLSDLLKQLPSSAFQPTSKDVTTDDALLKGNPYLSACIEDSLTHLSHKADNQERISAEDVFVDIVRHGTGNSVARLRTHGITSEKINAIVKQLGWNVIER